MLRSNLGKWVVVSCLASCGFAAPAVAQVKSLDEANSRALLNGAPALSWRLSLNPSWGHSLDLADDPITNENALKLSFDVKQSLQRRTYVGATAGVQANPKFATTVLVPGAGIFGQLRTGLRLPVGDSQLVDDNRDAFDVMGTYKLTHGYKDDDDATTDDEFSDHQFGAEVSFTDIRYLRARSADAGALKDASAYWKATGGYSRTSSSNESREKNSLTGTIDWNYAFLRQYPDVNLQGAIERSRFDEVLGARRRDTLYTFFAGLDLKKFVSFGGTHKALAGFKLSRLDSTAVGADDTRLVFQIGFDIGG